MKAAFYECDITPPLGGYMWGYYSKQSAKNVFDRLYAKAVVTENNGNIAAIVCVDTCVLPGEMHDIVTKRIEEYTGIKPENVCICSNHTHRGAPVFSSPEINQYADSAYTDVFYRLVADAVILAYQRLNDATASFGQSEVHGIAFNRNAIYDDGIYRTHARSEHTVEILDKIDPSLNIVKFEHDGKVIGAIVNYALHQDCTGGVPGYSGDYSSIISKELKKIYGPDFVSVFVLGTCGDINHVNNDISVDITDWNLYESIGCKIADEAKKVLDNTTPTGDEIAVIKEKITLSKRVLQPGNKAIETELQNMLDNKAGLMRIRNFLFYACTNESATQDLYVQVIKLGDLAIYALPGEVYVTYGLKIKSESPSPKTMVLQLSNAYCGYIPSEKAFDECSNLYEASLCYHSCMELNAGNIIVDKALEIGNRLFK